MSVQKIASDPMVSAKVTANAGTGKTYVLTQRVLRLLLSGVHPGKILCLTYTKAAAAEMVARVSRELQKWVTSPEREVENEIYNLTGEKPDAKQMRIARTLFSRTLESTPPPRIQTIHSFCQEVLKRFPLESGIPPYSEVIDDITARELIGEAQHRILSRQGVSEACSAAIEYFGSESSEKKFGSVVKEIISQRNNIREVIAANGGAEALVSRVYAALNFSGANAVELFFAADLTPDLADTEYAYAYRERNFEACREFLLTTKNEPRKKLEKVAPFEQQRILEVLEQIRKVRTAEFTKHVVNLASEFIEIYDRVKQERAVLDYDDLIYKTKDLLTNRDATAWVLFKLDGGIDHILVDEAQDTSPVQWEIIKALVDDFFGGATAREGNRTVFVVGDEKQSIYSFQGADPEALFNVTEYIRRKVAESGKAWHDLTLNKSFRSSGAVLQVVDGIFSDARLRQSVTSASEINHELHRVGDAGRVEVVPLFADSGDEEKLLWPLPGVQTAFKPAKSAMAEDIAKRIKGWLDDKRQLPARGRAIQPSDILILLRKRGDVADLVIKNLKRLNVPVSGADRLKICEHIAVQDLIALANFALLPDDDLNLAALIKSPLFGVTEKELFDLAYGREGRSIFAVIANNDNKLYGELKAVYDKADNVTIYEFFSYILDVEQGRRKFISRLGHEVNEILDEFMQLCLDFESNNTSSLQAFIHWLCSGEMEIKRDLEQGGGAVRVMTVHGSKGLEAPIVILADATSVPKFEQELFFAGGVLTANKSSGERCAELSAVYDARKNQIHEEYLRLLYVALTRASDELYVMGVEKRSSRDEDWYKLVAQTVESGALELPQEREVAVSKEYGVVRDETPLPGYMRVKVGAEEVQYEDLGEKQKVDKVKTARGKKIHKMLEVISRSSSADMSRVEPEIAEKIQLLLKDKLTARFFSPEARSELPMIGIVDGKMVSVRIDKLLFSGRDIYIVDYKTTQNPPATVPDAYRRQLELYAELVRRKYPDYAIKGGIVWTENGRFDEVDLTASKAVHISNLNVN